ncbi:hypothetical protein OFO12_04400 [Campylobacter sp. JMF_04 NA10]|uniref:hypothetical protein n=1 Tax=Campylobacter sp. JMF_04 NA10 TaxID=2983824 RepID=UPI0022E9A41A|nr:hypothetical protein [Campylobacter sp. JMF_04 NA10]MDA3076613.1 hypothetical protein [Campylobacter sp. JMF_04 NA10]
MRVFIDCECEIMQKSLEMFLANFAVQNLGEADFVVTDTARASAKPLFIIAKNGDLELPFSKEQLVLALKNFSASEIVQASYNKFEFSQNLDLEAQIGAVFDEFKARILEILRKQSGKI